MQDTFEMAWSVEDTTGFINVNAIRIGRDGEPPTERK